MRDFIEKGYRGILDNLREELTGTCAGDCSTDVVEIERNLRGYANDSKAQILCRITEEYYMAGTFSGQSDDVPGYFSKEEWQEIDRRYPFPSKDLVSAESAGIIGTGWGTDA